MVLPVLAVLLVFNIIPMFGLLMAFQEYQPAQGILGSPWVGFQHFITFLNDIYFWRLLRNTLLISLYDLIFVFPAPIVFALLLNEIRIKRFKRTMQTITYMPFFISLVVICGLIIDFTSKDGVLTVTLSKLGIVANENMLGNPELFRPIFIGSNIWQTIGFQSVIYVAALAGIDPELYEAASIDGAGRGRKMWHITLAGIAPTVVMFSILKIGGMLAVGFEKIILLYNPSIYETADVISSYVYRRGLFQREYSFGMAVSLFNSAISFVLLVFANSVARKVTDHKLF